MKHLKLRRLSLCERPSAVGGCLAPPHFLLCAHGGHTTHMKSQHVDGRAQLSAFYVCCSCSSMLMTTPTSTPRHTYPSLPSHTQNITRRQLIKCLFISDYELNSERTSKLQGTIDFAVEQETLPSSGYSFFNKIKSRIRQGLFYEVSFCFTAALSLRPFTNMFWADGAAWMNRKCWKGALRTMTTRAHPGFFSSETGN